VSLLDALIEKTRHQKVLPENGFSIFKIYSTVQNKPH